MLNVRRAWPAQSIVTVNGMPYTYVPGTTAAIPVWSSASKASAYQCRKCAGQGTRTHARKCPKRGLGHKGREAEARHVEALARDFGIALHVRRGRYGAGQSLDGVRDDVFRARCRVSCSGSTQYFRDLVAVAFGPGVTFAVDKQTATVDITAKNPTAEGLAMVRGYAPVGVLVRVNGVPV